VWIELSENPASLLVRLHELLRQELVVIEVEMSGGGRGRNLFATRYTIPRQGNGQNLSQEAKELLHEWREDSDGDGIAELASALIDDNSGPVVQVDSLCFEDRWADALIRGLVERNQLELRGGVAPSDKIAHHLQYVERDDFAASLLDVLIEIPSVTEI
jgi:hypothetical protein